jgi:hypothetical protein
MKFSLACITVNLRPKLIRLFEWFRCNGSITWAVASIMNERSGTIDHTHWVIDTQLEILSCKFFMFTIRTFLTVNNNTVGAKCDVHGCWVFSTIIKIKQRVKVNNMLKY